MRPPRSLQNTQLEGKEVIAIDKGWIPESMWTRLWEGDMEASYI